MHGKHRAGDAPPPALAARAGGHWPQGAMPTSSTYALLPILLYPRLRIDRDQQLSHLFTIA
eukprot:6213695-Pleurochrysis_carterae.AAC.1